MTDSHDPFQDDDVHDSGLLKNDDEHEGGLRQNKADGQSPGEMLREGRMAHDYSAEDLCAQTKLSPKTVKALEDNDFAALSQPVFARGYYRQCAKVLDLNSERLMTAYSVWAGEPPVRSTSSSTARPTPASPAAPAAKPTSVHVIPDDVTPAGGSRWRGLLLLLLIIAIAAAAVVVLWPRISSKLSSFSDNGANNKIQIQPNQGSDDQPADNPSFADDNPQDSNNDAASPNNAGSQDQNLDADGAPAVAGQADQQPQTGQTPGGRNVKRTLGITPPGQQNESGSAGSANDQPPAIAPNHLQLTFSKRSWVRVTDADGNRLASGIFEAGDSKEFNGKPPYEVTLGFAPGVAVSIGGQSVDVAGQTNGGSVAHLTINAPGDNG